MDPTSPVPALRPRVTTRDAFLLFGLGQSYHGQASAAIPSQWNRFVPHLGHIRGQVGDVTYGAICNADAAGNFDYVCAVEVTDFPDDPPEFTRLRIPPHTYAVFEHREHISSIVATMKAIWEHGLAEAGYAPTDGVTFERYDGRYDPGTGLGGLEIWVPIKT